MYVLSFINAIIVLFLRLKLMILITLILVLSLNEVAKQFCYLTLGGNSLNTCEFS